MKKETTAQRLRELMGIRNLRQTDILEKVKPYCQEYGIKIGKSHMSQYLSGKAEPKQDKLYILAAALDVNESWLMGFDAPMERVPDAERFEKFAEAFNAEHSVFVTAKQRAHLEDYKKLSDIGRQQVYEYTERILNLEQREQAVKASEDPQLLAAHERTDITMTAEEAEDARQHDLDLMSGLFKKDET